jgi:hypothetical protein
VCCIVLCCAALWQPRYTVLHNTARCSAVLHDTALCDAALRSAVPRCTAKCGAMRCRAARHTVSIPCALPVVRCGAALCSAMLFSVVLWLLRFAVRAVLSGACCAVVWLGVVWCAVVCDAVLYSKTRTVLRCGAQLRCAALCWGAMPHCAMLWCAAALCRTMLRCGASLFCIVMRVAVLWCVAR